MPGWLSPESIDRNILDSFFLTLTPGGLSCGCSAPSASVPAPSSARPSTRRYRVHTCVRTRSYPASRASSFLFSLSNYQVSDDGPSQVCSWRRLSGSGHTSVLGRRHPETVFSLDDPGAPQMPDKSTLCSRSVGRAGDRASGVMLGRILAASSLTRTAHPRIGPTGRMKLLAADPTYP